MLLLAGPIFIVGKYVAKALNDDSAPIISPHADTLVSLGGVTLHVERNSHAHKIANWLQLNTKGEQALGLGGDNFNPGAASLSPIGWDRITQLAHIMKAHQDITVGILYISGEDRSEPLQLKHQRAAMIYSELLKFGATKTRLTLGSEQFKHPGDTSPDPGLEIVLTRHA